MASPRCMEERKGKQNPEGSKGAKDSNKKGTKDTKGYKMGQKDDRDVVSTSQEIQTSPQSNQRLLKEDSMTFYRFFIYSGLGWI